MGFPTLYYERLRRTKGTRVFIVRDLFALGTIVVTSIIGVGFHYTTAANKLQTALERGDLDNSPEFEKKRLYLQKQMIPTSPERLAEHEERERTFMDGVIRTRELL